MLDPSTLGGLTPAQQLDSRTVEALGHAHFIERGWRVLISPYDSATYDFVAERDDTFVRVNVKRAGWSGGSYRIARAGKKPPGRDPDLYLVWLSRHFRFVELAAQVMVGKTHAIIPHLLWKDAIK